MSYPAQALTLVMSWIWYEIVLPSAPDELEETIVGPGKRAVWLWNGS